MKTYHIKRNGYTIGQARGKAKAVEHLQTVLGDTPAIWGIFKARMLRVHAEDNTYTIEEATQ